MHRTASQQKNPVQDASNIKVEKFILKKMKKIYTIENDFILRKDYHPASKSSGSELFNRKVSCQTKPCDGSPPVYSDKGVYKHEPIGV